MGQSPILLIRKLRNLKSLVQDYIAKVTARIQLLTVPTPAPQNPNKHLRRPMKIQALHTPCMLATKMSMPEPWL